MTERYPYEYIYVVAGPTQARFIAGGCSHPVILILTTLHLYEPVVILFEYSEYTVQVQ